MKKPRNIETDTPLLPRFIGEAVVEEADGDLKTELPDDLARRLETVLSGTEAPQGSCAIGGAGRGKKR